MSHIIEKEMTLLEALKLFFPDSSNRTFKQWLEFERVLIDGAVSKNPKLPLSIGQSLTVEPKKQTEFFNGVNILYHDRWIIVIDKPAGLLSVATDHTQDVHALQILRAYFKTNAIYAVHRIDRATSGVLLFARGKESEKAFDALFEQHLLTRQYLAVVEGAMPQQSGTWKSYLLEKENYDVVLSSEQEGGSLAITHYEVLRKSKKFTYLQLKLETGRKHQIRVHCQLAGHPVIGDKRYGSTLDPIQRLGLHATLLQFTHPFTQKQVTFTSPLPRAFSKIIS